MQVHFTNWSTVLDTHTNRDRTQAGSTSCLGDVSVWNWPQSFLTLRISSLNLTDEVKLKNTSASPSVQRYPNVTVYFVVMYSSLYPVEWTAAALTGQMEDHRPWRLPNKVHIHSLHERWPGLRDWIILTLANSQHGTESFTHTHVGIQSYAFLTTGKSAACAQN